MQKLNSKTYLEVATMKHMILYVSPKASDSLSIY